MDRMSGYLSRVKGNETKLQILKRKVEKRRTQKELIYHEKGDDSSELFWWIGNSKEQRERNYFEAVLGESCFESNRGHSGTNAKQSFKNLYECRMSCAFPTNVILMIDETCTRPRWSQIHSTTTGHHFYLVSRSKFEATNFSCFSVHCCSTLNIYAKKSNTTTISAFKPWHEYVNLLERKPSSNSVFQCITFSSYK